MERLRKSLENKLEKLQAEHRKDDVIEFEQLGVDRLFIDEAHSYKNLFFKTKMRNVAGLSTSDAQKSNDMFLKCRYMDEITSNRGVIFATGTPISNSMTELYTMQRYLQYDRLVEMGLIHFDSWASRFGETVTALELAPEGTGYRMRTRFSRFYNLPELMNLFREVADIKTADQLDIPKPEVEYHTVVSHPTEHQKELIKILSTRASEIHKGLVDPSKDNMLKITSDGRKLGLDQRIIDPALPDEASTKVNQCVENIIRIWQDGGAENLTQIVFCDISTPKTEKAKKSNVPYSNKGIPFSIYNDIRDKLIAYGIPENQVAFIHEANTEEQKAKLFSKVRNGQVRVLLGSTSKMGAGTNIQNRLIALHDLDCPWRPGDLTQRKGRIERQGNKNSLVHVYRYVTEGTFDSYLWQSVENKQKFISQIVSGKNPVRAFNNTDETMLSFAEIKSLCAGDPRIKERMTLDLEISKLKILKAAHKSKQYELQDSLRIYFPAEINWLKECCKGLEVDRKTVETQSHEGIGLIGVNGFVFRDKKEAGLAILDSCSPSTKDTVRIGSYKGFALFVMRNGFEYSMILKGQMSYTETVWKTPTRNIDKLEELLASIPARQEQAKVMLENLYRQQKAAEEEVQKKFLQEDELREKLARVAELDILLNIDQLERRSS